MNILRSEWLKWRTVRMHWLLLGIAIGLPVVVSVLTAIFRGSDEMVSRGSIYELVLGTSMLTAILAGVTSAVVTSGEYGHLTIRPTFAAMPRRGVVLAAKAGLTVVIGVITQLVVLVVSVTASVSILDNRGILSDIDGPDAMPAMAGSVAFVALMALIGHALGALFRSAPLSITTIILWPLLVEGIVGALLVAITDSQDALDWLPFRIGFEMLSYSGFDMSDGGMFDTGPTRIQASLYFGAVSVGLTLLASVVASRRDS